MSAAMTLFALVVIVFGALSARAGRAYVSAPMVFMVAGFALGSTSHYELHASTVKVVAELTLALLLFHGAAELRPRDLRTESVLTGRLLLIALPLSLVGTFVLVRLLLPTTDVWVALVISAALVPTDSALATATVLHPAVPARIRRLLTLESGLNDGLATPVVLFAIAAAAGTHTSLGDGGARGAVVDIVTGVGLGAAVGVVVGRSLRSARHRGWADETILPLAVLAIPLLCYYGASLLGGNGFMAAFVAGITYATTHSSPSMASADLELTHLGSALLGCAAWMLFGAATATHVAALVQWQSVVIAVAALTVLRMGPVALSLTGSGLGLRSRVFVGWFGPRGLPSVVFALIANDALTGQPGAATVVTTVAATVVLSVVGHGLTAPPLSARFGAPARGHAAPGPLP